MTSNDHRSRPRRLRRNQKTGRGHRPSSSALNAKAGLPQYHFEIDHIDGLGQGVSKAGTAKTGTAKTATTKAGIADSSAAKQDPSSQAKSEQNIRKQRASATTFIAKTLPGETGTARVYKRSKGVQFAKLETLEQSSSLRIEPECQHYGDCPGCHYLHTDYEQEIRFKHVTLKQLLRPLANRHRFSLDAIDVIPAPQRLQYRNRVQLHYRHHYIGMLSAIDNQIVEVPHCQLIRPELQAEFDALYSDKSWSKTAPSRGHCELYLDSAGQVNKRWDAPYADGGFTQVNEVMNQRLIEIVSRFFANKKPVASVLDLFSGGGNLSNHLVTGNPAESNCEAQTEQSHRSDLRRVLVDALPAEQVQLHDSSSLYLSLNLYDENALSKVVQSLAKDSTPLTPSTPPTLSPLDVLLLDPPRKGFADLAQWLSVLKPKQLIYVSCNAATLVRDLQKISAKLIIDDIVLLDLFPGTHHFETAVSVSLK